MYQSITLHLIDSLRYSTRTAEEAKKRQQPIACSWRIDGKRSRLFTGITA